MSIASVLLPVFVQVALTFALLFMQAGARMKLLTSGRVKQRDVSLREPNWPAWPTQVANAFMNQFELPVLFFVLVILAIITKQADYLFVVCSWLFVLFRVLQAWVFVTSNNMAYRGLYFAAGCFVLLMMWCIFAIRILVG